MSHYSPNTVKNYLSRLAGFFSNNRVDLHLDNSFWKKAEQSSELGEAMEKTKRYPDKDEIRLIIDLANNKDASHIFLGFQCGLVPQDIVTLRWESLGIDFDNESREFLWFETKRDKTGIQGVAVITPDLFEVLKGVWVDEGKPSNGWIFSGRGREHMHPKSLNKRFTDLAEKALGKQRASEITFKNLRDAYNEILLDSGIEQEIKDVLMMHKRESAKSRYPVSIATIVREYQEQVFPLISINGWRLKGRAAKTDELESKVTDLENALIQIEHENITYKTRIDNLQTQYETLTEDSGTLQQTIDTLTEMHLEAEKNAAIWQQIALSKMTKQEQNDVLDKAAKHTIMEMQERLETETEPTQRKILQNLIEALGSGWREPFITSPNKIGKPTQ